MPAVRVECVTINPLRGVSVAADLVVLFQRLRSDSSPLVKKCLYLSKNESISLQRGGVMGFLVPNIDPDSLRLTGIRKASQSLVKLS